jgi:activator of 2-hydroxyglutaryl-CoA dehydratase
MCAVFAESEVISLIAKKEKPENIGYGIADSVATRLVSLAKSLTIEDRVVFTGGGAKNILLQKLISEKIGKKVFVPKYPQMVGAFGSALIGIEIYQKEKS